MASDRTSQPSQQGQLPFETDSTSGSTSQPEARFRDLEQERAAAAAAAEQAQQQQVQQQQQQQPQKIVTPAMAQSLVAQVQTTQMQRKPSVAEPPRQPTNAATQQKLKKRGRGANAFAMVRTMLHQFAQIVKRFSSKDQQLLVMMGQRLVGAGMEFKYERNLHLKQLVPPAISFDRMIVEAQKNETFKADAANNPELPAAVLAGMHKKGSIELS